MKPEPESQRVNHPPDSDFTLAALVAYSAHALAALSWR
jgi:hypothetical protein